LLTELQLDNRYKLVKALRSGRYKQGKFALKQVDDEGNTSFCCLGVACDLLGRTEMFGRRLEDAGVLDDDVMEAYGFESPNAAYANKERCLASDNDEGKSFEQIADIIVSLSPGLVMD